MNVIRDRADARWLPTRFHFALFRLGAFLRKLSAPREEAPGTIWAIDDGQSSLENYSVAVWVFATTACYVTAWLGQWLAVWAAAAVGLAATPWLLHLPLFAVGLALRREGNNHRAVSATMFALLFAASAVAVTRPGWVRWIGVTFFAAAAANALAALVMFLLRERVRRMERECGA